MNETAGPSPEDAPVAEEPGSSSPEAARRAEREQKRQQLQAQLRDAPRRVQRAVWLTQGVGVLFALRGFAVAYAHHMPPMKFGLLLTIILATMWWESFGIALRRRSAYVIVIAIALLPLVSLLGNLVHLPLLMISGRIQSEWPRAIVAALGQCQLVLTAMLLWHLLSREVRDHVWKPPPPNAQP